MKKYLQQRKREDSLKTTVGANFSQDHDARSLSRKEEEDLGGRSPIFLS